MDKKASPEKLLQKIKELEDQVLECNRLEEQLERIFNLSPDIIGSGNLQGYFTKVNSSFERVLGYPEGYFLKKPFIKFVHKDDVEKTKKAIADAAKGERDIHIENRYKCRDGSYKWIEWRVLSIPEENQFIAVGRDISERKAAEELIREKEAKYQDLYDNAPDMFVSVDIKTATIIECNKTLAHNLGYEKRAIIHKPITDIYAPESAKRVKSTLLPLFIKTGEIKDEELQLRKKDGGIIDVRLNSSSVRNEKGDILYSRSILRDITLRKRTEEELKRSEEKYRTILENMDEGYYEADLTGRILFSNEAFCNMIGYTREELFGMNYRKEKLKKAFPEAADKAFHIFNEVYRTGKSMDVEQHNIIRKDGSIGIHELSISLLKSKDDKPIGFRGITRDITERCRAEEEKRRIEAQLQQIQKMEAIGTLAGGIAHDFNNLLMSIQGKASIMLYNLNKDHPLYDPIRSIEQLIQSGSEITQQLLGFAREGKFEIKPVNINNLVKNSSKMFASTKKELRIHTTLQRNVWTAEVDPSQIDQVLLNLFVNASQAMPKGGDIYIETENIKLDEHFVKPYFVKPGKFVRISVIDTGIGMDEKTIKRIFDPFFTTKEMSRGTGLGLSSAYGIIQNHHGIINAYSEKGKGTTFNMYLPASEKRITKDIKHQEQVKKGTETILLIDDEKRIIETASEMLKLLGFKVGSAKSGKEAIQIYRKSYKEIDLIILDMVLPEMDGSEIYDNIKEINPEVKVLLSSGYSVDGMASEILAKGCNGFIQKPFTLEKFSQKISDVLGK